MQPLGRSVCISKEGAVSSNVLFFPTELMLYERDCRHSPAPVVSAKTITKCLGWGG